MRIFMEDDKAHKEIGYNYAFTMLDIENIVPRKIDANLTPWEHIDVMRSEENRKRFVDMLSANIAWALTDYLVKERTKEKV
jgi:hypothetical protein